MSFPPCTCHALCTSGSQTRDADRATAFLAAVPLAGVSAASPAEANPSFPAPWQEKDLHSGLIGPLIICRREVLSFVFRRQLAVQEFSLLFTIFDETKSWYFLENMERNCRPPCRIQQDNPDFKRNHSFHGEDPYPCPFHPTVYTGMEKPWSLEPLLTAAFPSHQRLHE